MERAVDKAIAEVQTEIENVLDPIERLRVGIGKYLELLLEGDDALFVHALRLALAAHRREARARSRAPPLRAVLGRPARRGLRDGQVAPDSRHRAGARTSASAPPTGSPPGTAKTRAAPRRRSPTRSGPSSPSACSTRAPPRRRQRRSSQRSQLAPKEHRHATHRDVRSAVQDGAAAEGRERERQHDGAALAARAGVARPDPAARASGEGADSDARRLQRATSTGTTCAIARAGAALRGGEGRAVERDDRPRLEPVGVDRDQTRTLLLPETFFPVFERTRAQRHDRDASKARAAPRDDRRGCSRSSCTASRARCSPPAR